MYSTKCSWIIITVKFTLNDQLQLVADYKLKQNSALTSIYQSSNFFNTHYFGPVHVNVAGLIQFRAKAFIYTEILDHAARHLYVMLTKDWTPPTEEKGSQCVLAYLLKERHQL